MVAAGELTFSRNFSLCKTYPITRFPQVPEFIPEDVCLEHCRLALAGCSGLFFPHQVKTSALPAITYEQRITSRNLSNLNNETGSKRKSGYREP
jgi:hypothetical protein